MTRKKKQFPQQKRQQVMDSSGWTHIVKGAKNVMTSVKALASNQHQTSFTVDSYANTFRTKYTPQWRESSCWRGLTCMIEREILASENITLTKCVCLGLGSLTVGSHTDTSSYELAALVSMLGLLGKKHAIREVIFQDPAFNHLDKTFLDSLGYEVLSDPEAFAKVDDNTFVFAPHLEVAHITAALENSTPAVYIGNDINEYVDSPFYRRIVENHKPGSTEIFKRYADRTEFKAMPDFDRTSWARETSVYWLKDPARSNVCHDANYDTMAAWEVESE